MEWGSEATFENNVKKKSKKFEMTLNPLSPPQNIFKLYKKLGALTAKTKGVLKGLIAVW